MKIWVKFWKGQVQIRQLLSQGQGANISIVLLFLNMFV